MAEIRTPVVISKRSNIGIDHEDGDTVITYLQEVRIKDYHLGTAPVLRLLASHDQNMVSRVSRAAIKSMPLPALPPEPTHWNGVPATEVSAQNVD